VKGGWFCEPKIFDPTNSLEEEITVVARDFLMTAENKMIYSRAVTPVSGTPAEVYFFCKCV